MVVDVSLKPKPEMCVRGVTLNDFWKFKWRMCWIIANFKGSYLVEGQARAPVLEEGVVG